MQKNMSAKAKKRGVPPDPTRPARLRQTMALASHILLKAGGRDANEVEDEILAWLRKHPKLPDPILNSRPGKRLRAMRSGEFALSWEALNSLEQAGRALGLLSADIPADELPPIKSSDFTKVRAALAEGYQLMQQLHDTAAALATHLRKHANFIAVDNSLVRERRDNHEVIDLYASKDSLAHQLLDVLEDCSHADFSPEALRWQLQAARLVPIAIGTKLAQLESKTREFQKT